MSSAHPVPPTGAIANISRGSVRPMKPPCFTPYLIARGILGSRWITEEITDVVPVLHSPCILALSLDWLALCLGRWNAEPCARPLAPPGRGPRRRAPPATQLLLLHDRSGRPVAPANLRGRQHREAGCDPCGASNASTSWPPLGDERYRHDACRSALGGIREGVLQCIVRCSSGAETPLEVLGLGACPIRGDIGRRHCSR